MPRGKLRNMSMKSSDECCIAHLGYIGITALLPKRLVWMTLTSGIVSTRPSQRRLGEMPRV
jgi:hypothetical protein